MKEGERKWDEKERGRGRVYEFIIEIEGVLIQYAEYIDTCIHLLDVAYQHILEAYCGLRDGCS